MLQLLFLVHAAIAVFMLFTRPLAAEDRARFVRLGAMGGMIAAVALFLVRGSDATWGAATLRPGAVAVSSAAIFCAWALVAAGTGGGSRWDIGALVGVGATGLCLFASSDWAVPALLYWATVSLAAAVAVPAQRRSAGVWLALAISDVCAVGGLIAYSLDAETWRLPDAIDDWMLVPMVVAIVLRTGVAAGVGLWELNAGAQVALLPLVVGSGFALVPSVSGGDEIYIAGGILIAAVALAAWAILSATPRVATFGAWITAAMLATVWIYPEVLARAGAAALLGVTVVALWPSAAGRGQAERGLILAAVPLTVGFGVVVGGAAASFESATLAESVLDSAPWSAFAALLPVALAAGVTLGAGIARRREPERYEPTAVLATWGIAAIGLLLGLTPRPDLTFGGGGPAGTRGTWLFAIAAVAGLVAARLRPPTPAVAMETSAAVAPHGSGGRAGFAKPLALAAALAGIPALLAIAWFTYEGLRNGFL